MAITEKPKALPAVETAIPADKSVNISDTSIDETDGVSARLAAGAGDYQEVGVPAVGGMGKYAAAIDDVKMNDIAAPTEEINEINKAILYYTQQMNNASDENGKAYYANGLSVLKQNKQKLETNHITSSIANTLANISEMRNPESVLQGYNSQTPTEIRGLGQAAIQTGKQRMDFIAGQKPKSPLLEDPDVAPMLIGMAGQIALGFGLSVGGWDSTSTSIMGRAAPEIATTTNNAYVELETQRAARNEALTKAYTAAKDKWATNMSEAMKDMGAALSAEEKLLLEDWAKSEDRAYKDFKNRQEITLNSQKAILDGRLKAKDISIKEYNSKVNALDKAAGVIKMVDDSNLQANSNAILEHWHLAQAAIKKTDVQLKAIANKDKSAVTLLPKYQPGTVNPYEESVFKNRLLSAIKNPETKKQMQIAKRAYQNQDQFISNIIRHIKNITGGKAPTELSEDVKNEVRDVSNALQAYRNMIKNTGTVFNHSVDVESDVSFLKTITSKGQKDGKYIYNIPKGFEDKFVKNKWGEGGSVVLDGVLLDIQSAETSALNGIGVSAVETGITENITK